MEAACDSRTGCSDPVSAIASRNESGPSKLLGCLCSGGQTTARRQPIGPVGCFNCFSPSRVIASRPPLRLKRASAIRQITYNPITYSPHHLYPSLVARHSWSHGTSACSVMYTYGHYPRTESPCCPCAKHTTASHASEHVQLPCYRARSHHAGLAMSILAPRGA